MGRCSRFENLGEVGNSGYSESWGVKREGLSPRQEEEGRELKGLQRALVTSGCGIYMGQEGRQDMG